jgi:hypothetical protein
MNKFYQFLSIMAVSVMLLTACDDDGDDSNNLPNPTQGISMTAKVNGAEWRATAPVASDSGSLMTIAGFAQSDSTNISFIIDPKPTAAITYDLADSTSSALALYTGAGGFLPVFGETGSLAITNFNSTTKTMSGTFTFSGYSYTLTGDSTLYSITEGKFTNLVIVSL